MARTLTPHRSHDIATMSKFALEDARISWRAKGLLLYLMNMTPGTVLSWRHVEGLSCDGKDAVLSARRELVDAGYLVEGEEHTTCNDGMVAGNPQHSPEKLRESRKPRPSKGSSHPHTPSVAVAGKPQEGGAAPMPSTSSVLTQSLEVIKTTAPAHVHTHAHEGGDLFGEAADKVTIMRKSLFTLEVCKSKFAEVYKLGVDVDYYFDAILDWSNKKPRTFRDAHGWAATVKTAMRRDKDKGCLRLADGGTTSDEAALKYLNA